MVDRAIASKPDGMLSLRTVLWVWLPIALTTVMHYATGSEAHGVHGVLRRVYYLPIIVAAFRHGFHGGLTAAAVATVAYLPHAFSDVGHHDPAPWIEKVLELALYNIVGAVAGLLASRELASRQRVELALAEQRALQAQLVRAGKLAALGEVVAGVAHEVRNPLHALKGSAEFVGRELEDGRAQSMWKLHLRELDRLERVAERFLNFARPAELSLARVDLGVAVTHALELVRAQAGQSGVTIDFSAPVGTLLVLGDREQLVQVILNLSINAVRAAATQDMPGKVEISICRADDGVRVVVDNTGCSIEGVDRERIFDPFFTMTPGGSGLGLSISARIVEQHRGRLSVSDGPLGTRFSMWLPEG